MVKHQESHNIQGQKAGKRSGVGRVGRKRVARWVTLSATAAMLGGAIAGDVAFGAALTSHAGGTAALSDILPASGAALVLEEGAKIEDIYVEPAPEPMPGYLGTISAASVSEDVTVVRPEEQVTMREVLRSVSEDAGLAGQVDASAQDGAFFGTDMDQDIAADVDAAQTATEVAADAGEAYDGRDADDAGNAAEAEDAQDIVSAQDADSAEASDREVIDLADFSAQAVISIAEEAGSTAVVTPDEITARERTVEDAVSAVALGAQTVRDIKDSEAMAEQEELERDPEHFSNLVIAQCIGYVHVRDIPSTDGEIVGKLYADSVGTYLEEVDGWYKISSGSCVGYVSGDYCITGEAAIEKAKEVGTRLAVVNTTTLKVRMEPSTDAPVLTLVPLQEDLVVLEELDGWVKVTTTEGDGYVSAEYVDLHTEFVKAESKAEEEARLAREAEERRRAQEAAQQAVAQRNANNNTARTGSNSTYNVPDITGSGLGSQVAQYACQFVGNPYVYGGSSLTNGTDCSGFVMSVYRNFGVSLPHSSRADRSAGYAVEGGLAAAQPGDIICYSGHVALYIGNGQIVHASNSKTGIIISNANYNSVLAVRRIF